MKKIIALALAAFLLGGIANAQHHGNCGNCPNHAKHQAAQGRQATECTPQSKTNADGVDMFVVRAFPTVKSVKNADKWNEVYDSNKKLLGYVVYSKPASDGIKGYAGETPVMIAFDAKKVITGVYLLQNQETPKFVERVEKAGYFDNWNGLTVKNALKKEVDAVSGATFTSRAVAQSVEAALKTLK